jgi:hypothetical protein
MLWDKQCHGTQITCTSVTSQVDERISTPMPDHWTARARLLHAEN